MSAHSKKVVHHKLGPFPSTAIAGNDILSSCLYVSGVAILFAGVYAPLIFLLVALVLFFYKYVYTEVVEALPLNGGAYNGLINASNKPLAAMAGVMTVLSYVATSVISAKTASEYLHTILPSVPVLGLTMAIIIGFAILTSLGVKDSSKVAITIFLVHVFTLTLFIGMGLLLFFNDGIGTLQLNWHNTQGLFAQSSSLKMLFFAFCASLLGVSGFESSANFVESQTKGTFPLTLKYMLLGILIVNPLISLVLLNVLSLSEISVAQNFILSEAAFQIGGMALKGLLVIDAFLVLCGAVLASFIGATGLLYRMTIDHCLPSAVLLPKLKHRNKDVQRIILLFAGLAISILLLTGGHFLSLAGVYTLSFLGVMTVFALGNLILRINRPELKRPFQAPLPYVIFAMLGTGIGFIGNIFIDPKNLLYFLIYFIPSVTVVLMMIFRDYLLEGLLNVVWPIKFLRKKIQPLFEHVIRNRIILFIHHPENLYTALDYIRRNETSRRITIVFCLPSADKKQTFVKQYMEFLRFFKEAQIFPQFDLNLIVEEDMPFSPDVVKIYAQRFKIGRNNIFIGSIHNFHHFSFEEFGGVRIVQ